MKKSTLLTMASVGAVALTSAMTFAAWDNLSDTTTSNEVTFKQINVEKAADIVLTEPVASDLTSSYVPSSTGYTLEIYDGTEESAEKVAGNVDKSLTGTNTYKVVVTATDDKAGTDALANKKVTVELKATLQKTTV